MYGQDSDPRMFLIDHEELGSDVSHHAATIAAALYNRGIVFMISRL